MLGAGAARASSGRAESRRFLWGTAGSSYQIEGGNVGSDVWVLEHVKPSVFREPSGDAANTFGRINDDLGIAASLGFNCHRLSLEWSRIEPERGQISRAALDYYRGVLEACHAKGLTPVVTYNHWTVPRWFAEAGGFQVPEAVASFASYCRLVTEHMGDVIGLGATLNEANIVAQLSWVPSLAQFRPFVQKMLASAATATGSSRFSSMLFADNAVQQPILLEAHSRAYEAIKSVRPDLPVGVTLSLNDDQPAGPDSAVARKEAEVWTPWLGSTFDWIGVQTYTRARVGPNSDLPPPAGAELTEAGFEFWPQALEAVLRKVAAKTKKPIYVTENGIATADDTRRVEYIRQAVGGMNRCRADGLDVRGYMHWSLVDNWEWHLGYSATYGLLTFDRTTFKRIPKPSAYYLGKIAQGHI